MFTEDDLLPISALQHLAFCERQCALIHVERVWIENRLTAEGRLLHERTHEHEAELRGDTRIVRGLALRSLALGLSGIADVVEFEGEWVFPVEYKRGKPKPDECDKVQLCAQAMCLEEMLGASVPRGALFYGKTRRREDVELDEALRERVRAAARRLHELIGLSQTPPARYDKAKCDRCSLFDLCAPKTIARGKSARRYLKSALEVDSNETHPSDFELDNCDPRERGEAP